MIALAQVALAGTLAGTVRDPAGAAVAATVTAVDPNLGEIETVAGPDGSFLFDLPDGLWRIRATPPPGTSEAVTWAPSAGTRCEAALYEVGRVEDVALVLLRGAEIRGAIDGPDGAPTVGATVTVFEEYVTPAPEAVTAADGTFTLRGVPEGSVLLGIDADGVPYQFWGGTTVGATAAPWPVGGGEVLDLGRTTLLAGAAIAGTVTGPQGPVTGGTVSAYAPSQIVEAAIGPDGGFEVVGIPAGDVLVWAEVPGLATTYWPDADRPAGRLSVGDGERADLVDLVLPGEATVHGRVVGDEPWTGATAVLYNSDRTIGVGALVEEDGSFALGQLHGGAYTLWIEGGVGGRVTGELVGDDGVTRVLEVPAEGVLALGDIDLPEGASLRGRATDAATGEPVAASVVLALPGDPRAARTALTGADGTFAIDGLGSGAWEVSIGHGSLCASDPGWVSLWLGDTPNPLFATPLVVAPGQVSTWDPELPPDHDHDGMDDRWERRNALDPTVDDGARDPDEDGFSNLEEYLLGTDPTDGEEKRCGCAGASGGLGAAWLALGTARRRTRPHPDRARGPRGPSGPSRPERSALGGPRAAC